MDIEEKIRNAVVPKEKKWMYNFALRMHKLIEKGDYDAFQVQVNNYYYQHAKGMYTARYRTMSEEEKEFIKKKNAERNKEKKYNEKYQKTMQKIYKMYRKGQLSSESLRKINKEVAQYGL